MLALLRTRRWLGFTATGLAAILVFGLLSQWQWHRAEEKRAAQAALLSRAGADPVPVDQAMAAGQPLAADAEWTAVRATGRYDPASQVLVRRRPLGGQNGFQVAVALRTATGVLWVDRGWLAAGGDARAALSAPAPPAGQVTVTGRLRVSQDGPDRQPGDLPAGQVTDLDVAALSAQAAPGEPAFGGYVELTGSVPADAGGLSAWPLPEIDPDRNVSYAGQWLLFALVVVVGWFLFLRREAAEDARRDGGDREPTRTP